MTKIQQTLFVSIFAILAAGATHAADTAKNSRTVSHQGASAKFVQKEALHPTANLSYKVAGKRYTPKKSAENFSQTGRASWYGPGFHGKRTSSGEKFDMNALTAAHRTLPIPSYARVTNLANGKSVVVRINDRGPFHSARVMDMSKGAAKALGFLSHGSADIRIEALKAGDRIDRQDLADNNKNFIRVQSDKEEKIQKINSNVKQEMI